MKIVKNKLYDKYTKIVINRDTDFKQLTKRDLEDIFDSHCVSVGVLSRVVNYFYDLIQKDKNI